MDIFPMTTEIKKQGLLKIEVQGLFEDLTERLRAANQGKLPFEEQIETLGELRSSILENKKMEQDLLL